MMLDEKKDLVIAKLIGITNGLYSENAINDFKEDFYFSLNAIKNDKDLDKALQLLINDKKKYLGNCLTCKAPCGRTSDVSILKIENEDFKRDKIAELNQILDSIDKDDFMTLAGKICCLAY